MADVELDFDFNTRKAESDLKRIDKGVKKVGKSAGRVTSAFSRLSKIKAPSFLVGAVGTAAITAGIGKSLDLALNFEDAMKNVNTILKVSGSELDTFGTEVRQLSQDFGLDATSLALSLKDIASAQFTGAEALGILEQAAIGARAGFVDVQAVTPGIIAAMKTFGVTANEALDASAFAADKGIISYDGFARSLQTAGGIAKAAGLTLGDFAAGMAKLTEAGLTSEIATTNLKAALRDLGKLDIREKLKAFTGGLDIGDLGFAQRIEIISKFSAEDKDFLSKIGFSDESKAGLLGLINRAGTSLTELAEQGKDLAEFSGAAFDRSKSQLLAFQKVQQELIEAFRSMGEKFAPVALKIVSDFSTFLKDNKEQLNNFGQFVRDMALGARELAFLLSPFSALASRTNRAVENIGATLVGQEQPNRFPGGFQDLISRTRGPEQTLTSANLGDRASGAIERDAGLFEIWMNISDQNAEVVRNTRPNLATELTNR